MRDPKRISAVMKLITALWTANPDLRLMQLLLNATNNYYLEDNELEELLIEYYGDVK